MKLTKLLVLLAVFVSLFAIPAHAQKSITDADFSDVVNAIEGTFPERRVTGKVVGVHDGDTATVLESNKTQYKFRFNGTDAPELKQDFGQRSKQNLSKLIFGKQVTVVLNKIDKYGRYVGKIFVGGVDVNLEQIKAGFAYYKKYADEQPAADRRIYASSETAAREAKLGLWQMPNPILPWNYRMEIKAKQETAKANRKYLRGTKGGCYYINSNGNKTYVDKKFCN